MRARPERRAPWLRKGSWMYCLGLTASLGDN